MKIRSIKTALAIAFGMFVALVAGIVVGFLDGKHPHSFQAWFWILVTLTVVGSFVYEVARNALIAAERRGFKRGTYHAPKWGGFLPEGVLPDELPKGVSFRVKGDVRTIINISREDGDYLSVLEDDDGNIYTVNLPYRLPNHFSINPDGTVRELKKKARS